MKLTPDAAILTSAWPAPGEGFGNIGVFQVLEAAGLFDKDSFHSVRSILRK